MLLPSEYRFVRLLQIPPIWTWKKAIVNVVGIPARGNMATCGSVMIVITPVVLRISKRAETIFGKPQTSRKARRKKIKRKKKTDPLPKSYETNGAGSPIPSRMRTA